MLTGIGTVHDDDPRLDVRLVPTTLQPLRVILDSQLRTPPTARILQPPGSALLVGAAPALSAGRVDGVECLSLADGGANPAGRPARPSIPALLEELNRRAVNEVHVEAGPTLNGAWLAGGWVDELLVYVAPLLVGPGRPLAALEALPALAAAPRWQLIDTIAIGSDVRLRYRSMSADGCRKN